MYQLLRNARKAVSNKDYAEACALYRDILEHDKLGNIDYKFRLAWCSEKAGYINDACFLYEEIIFYYNQKNEQATAASLQVILNRLRKPKEMTSAIDFEALASADRTRLMRQLRHMGTEQTLEKGKALFEEGDVAKNLWVLVRGCLLQSKETREHAMLSTEEDGRPKLLGEASVFTLQRREFTVTASIHSKLLSIPLEKITHLRQKSIDFDIAMEHLMREYWVAPILTSHPIFQRVNDIDRVRISHLFEPIEQRVGECLMRRNEEHPAAYLLQEGCLFLLHECLENAEKNDDDPEDGALLASVLPGSFVHLGGLLRGYESSCRIVAITPVRLLRLNQETFESISTRRPWMIQALLRLVRLPVKEQVAQPSEATLWKINHDIELRQVAQDDEYD
ncbi:MAG: cyclic nucleotide-binding domain-containing protein [Mariprofundaceae bacterium]|nr:cyclic nucleotide-binding domain-containing protein [Mariprofundaceae bacterium]